MKYDDKDVWWCGMCGEANWNRISCRTCGIKGHN